MSCIREKHLTLEKDFMLHGYRNRLKNTQKGLYVPVKMPI